MFDAMRMVPASIIGSGPNGLAAAIVLAKAGLETVVFEGESQPGGAARTMELTLPGFHHDFGAAVHPMGAGSPFFRTLSLADYGLQWIHGEAAVAHPLDNETAVTLEHSFENQETVLGHHDGRVWRKIVEPLATHWNDFAANVLGPVTSIPRRPLLMAHFARYGLRSAARLAKSSFENERTRALFAGLAAHSFLSLDQPLTSGIGLVFAAAAHSVGWPIPRGGSQSIIDALIGCLANLGGTVHTDRRIVSLEEIDGFGTASFGTAGLKKPGLILCDFSPRQLLSIAGNRLKLPYRESLGRFRAGPGAFKIDYALSSPIPWKSAECTRAITVHLGGSLSEIALSEQLMANGQTADCPFVLVAQPSLFDSTRAPQGKHIAWAYCHVPNGSTIDMTERIERQIERFAPGFRDCILARCVSPPSVLESMDPNLLGGDIMGGEFSIGQIIFRPARGNYYTGTPNLFLCSASTPPGGGVHGMCGYHAARTALRRLRRR